MAVKEWFRQLQPVQLYVILTLTVVFFVTELVVSHITHALTLLLDSYHMLCNIIALTGCIITIKYKKKSDTQKGLQEEQSLASSVGEELESNPSVCTDNKQAPITAHGIQQENKLKNTFGWARIDVVVMLICCVFLGSLCFSIVIEALQTLAHIDHHDEMHHPIPVLCLGAIGLLLNGVCYLLIGGFTFHQGSFLFVTESGDVVLDKVVTNDSVRKGERRLSRTRTVPSPQYRQRQGFREMLRDVIGCVFVIIGSFLVYCTKEEVAKFIDPILSIVSSVFLMILSYPYMRESCLILLQTIPATINIESLKAQLQEHFPDIINVHDLHIWQLTASKVISTAHIIFQNPKVYEKITDSITEFFQEHGITQVTIQPEFFSQAISCESLNSGKSACLMRCLSEGCKTSHCCPDNVTPHSPLSKSVSLELLRRGSAASLKAITVEDNPKTESNPVERNSGEELEMAAVVQNASSEEKQQSQTSQSDLQVETLKKSVTCIDKNEISNESLNKIEVGANS